MQGTAADIIKLAMIKVDDWLSDKSTEVKMIMQVHDELVFEIQQDKVDYYKKELSLLMTSAAKL